MYTKASRVPKIAGCKELPQYSAEVNGSSRPDRAMCGFRGVRRGTAPTGTPHRLAVARHTRTFAPDMR